VRHRPPGLRIGIVFSLLGLAMALAAARALRPARVERWRARWASYVSAPSLSRQH
jgi:hypothetical protein